MNTATNNTPHSNLKVAGYAIFCGLACLTALAIGGLFQPGVWYTQINIAPWSPPNYVFPIVWTFLYVCIAIAGWLIFKQGNALLKFLWCIQLCLNAAWSWIFFGEFWTVIALIDIILIIVIVCILIAKCWHTLRATSYLLIPYVAWLLVASSLNLYIIIAN